MTKNKLAIQEHYLVTRTLGSILEPEQLKMLMGRTPRKAIATRPGPSDMTLAYVPHSYVRAFLNLVFGWNWDFQLLPIEDGKKYCINESEGRKKSVTALGRLTVRVTDANGNILCTIVKEDFGGSDWKSKQILTDAVKGASSDALKRCAMSLGIGLDLYAKDPDQMQFVPMSEAQERIMELAKEFARLKDSGMSVTEIRQKLDLEAQEFRTVMEQAAQNKKVGE